MQRLPQAPHAFLLALTVGLFPLMALWSSNLGQIAPSAGLPSLLFTGVFVTVIFLAWLAAVQFAETAALLSGVTFIFLFSFGHIYNLVSEGNLLGLSLGVIKLLVVMAIAYAPAIFLLLKHRPRLNLSVLLLPVGVLFLYNAFTVVAHFIRSGQPNRQAVAEASIESDSSLPDIYFIVLDAYAREDVLRQVIGYDNSAFLDALRQRGFYLPKCPFSNYDGTVHAVTSVLNSSYLDSLGIARTGQNVFESPDLNLIYDSWASQTFHAYGYKFVTGRGYASFNDITTSDVYLNYAVHQGNQDDLAQKRFTHLYLSTTVFRALMELYQNNPENFPQLPAWLMIDAQNDTSLEEANFWYQQNNFMFDSLEQFYTRPGSYFVYAHINAPHGPYVYRPDGSFRYPMNDAEEPVLYAETLTYLNNRVLAMIDSILANSDPDPIIILQGDHGIHKMTSGVDKHKILSAYYLPGSPTTPPYDTITPVNNFRLILRNYLDPSIELLPDLLWVKRANEYEAVPATCGLQP